MYLEKIAIRVCVGCKNRFQKKVLEVRFKKSKISFKIAQRN